MYRSPPPWFRLGWIGLCVVALVALTRLLYGLPARIDWLDGFVFGGTVFAYHFRYPVRRWRRAAWLAGALGGICYFLLPRAVQLLAVVPAMLWIFYYGPSVYRPKATRRLHLRARPVAKPVTIALTWSWVTVLLPLALVPGAGFSHALAVLPLFTGRAAFIFALALAYDLVDVDDDRRRGLATLAGRLGYRPSLGLIAAALSVSAVCISLNFWRQVYTASATVALLVSLAASAAVLFWLLRSATAAGWKKAAIDGLMIVQWALVMMNF